ncbi:hypothetical protein [Brevibacillus sp. H7]|uniref:hypothetical protein n=1 Tax=Brevibacillus sp. H7 TaxID=3349138 RepID=UPI0038129832
MKRIAFATPEELTEHCLREEISLVIEYRDEHNKQRQVVLQGEELNELEEYFRYSGVTAYYRKDGIFYEIKAEWLR